MTITKKIGGISYSPIFIESFTDEIEKVKDYTKRESRLMNSSKDFSINRTARIENFSRKGTSWEKFNSGDKEYLAIGQTENLK